MAPDYDNDDLAPADLATAMSYKDSASTAVYSNFSITLTPKLMFATAPHKYTRVFTNPTPETRADYDCGNLFILESIASGSALAYGDFWVSYDITLRSPQVPRPPTSVVPVGAVNTYRLIAPSPDLELGTDFQLGPNLSMKVTPNFTQIPDIKFQDISNSFYIPPNTTLDFLYNLDLSFLLDGKYQDCQAGSCVSWETSPSEIGPWTQSSDSVTDSTSGQVGEDGPGTRATLTTNPTIFGTLSTLATALFFRPLYCGYLNRNDGTIPVGASWTPSANDVIKFTNLVRRIV